MNHKQRNSIYNFAIFSAPTAIIFFVYFLLFLLDIQFLFLWSQVTDIYEFNQSTGNEIALGNRDFLHNHIEVGHILRYKIIVPIFYMAERMGIDSSVIFSALKPLIVSACCLSLQYYSGGYRPPTYLSILVLFCFCSVFLFMDGRLTLAFLGACTTLLGLRISTLKKISNLFFKLSFVLFGLFLCSVTSGIFTLSILFVALCSAFDLSIQRINLAQCLYYTFLFLFSYLLYGFYFIDGIQRSFYFFGDDLYSVIIALDHGILRTLIGIDVNGAVLIIFLTIICVALWIVYQFGRAFFSDRLIIYPAALGSLSAVMGLWGLSVASLMLVAIAAVLARIAMKGRPLGTQLLAR